MSTCPRCHPRYCAPARCYCGHPECPAFDTHRERTPINVTDITNRTSKAADLWASREEPTWMDR